MPKYPIQLESDEYGERWRTRGDQIVRAVHSVDVCVGRCVLHYPTEHHMRDWRLHWRVDRHFFERICPHGIGHPDPDEMFYGQPHPESRGIHGCDGCCWSGTENEICGAGAETKVNNDDGEWLGIVACIQEPGHVGPHVSTVSWGSA